MQRKRLQIGVMGSAADLSYSEVIERSAVAVGVAIARSGNVLVYGAEKDVDSLSTAAARGAKRAGGLTVGVTYGKGKIIRDTDGITDVIIATGLERGGGREFVLVNSCDAIILISGGSGTLTEAAIAYQADIPIVALTSTGGWADRLAGTFLDSRERRRVIPVTSPQEAVSRAIEEAVTI